MKHRISVKLIASILCVIMIAGVFAGYAKSADVFALGDSEVSAERGAGEGTAANSSAADKPAASEEEGNAEIQEAVGAKDAVLPVQIEYIVPEGDDISVAAPIAYSDDTAKNESVEAEVQQALSDETVKKLVEKTDKDVAQQTADKALAEAAAAVEQAKSAAPEIASYTEYTQVANTEKSLAPPAVTATEESLAGENAITGWQVAATAGVSLAYVDSTGAVTSEIKKDDIIPADMISSVTLLSNDEGISLMSLTTPSPSMVALIGLKQEFNLFDYGSTSNMVLNKVLVGVEDNTLPKSMSFTVAPASGSAISVPFTNASGTLQSGWSKTSYVSGTKTATYTYTIASISNGVAQVTETPGTFSGLTLGSTTYSSTTGQTDGRVTVGGTNPADTTSSTTYKPTASLTDADKTDSTQMNIQMDTGSSSSDLTYLSKAAQWTDKVNNEGKITLGAALTKETVTQYAGTPVYFMQVCNAHGFSAAIAKDNINWLIGKYGKVEVLAMNTRDNRTPVQQTLTSTSQTDGYLAQLTFSGGKHYAMSQIGCMYDYLIRDNKSPSAVYVTTDGISSFTSPGMFYIESPDNASRAEVAAVNAKINSLYSEGKYYSASPGWANHTTFGYTMSTAERIKTFMANASTVYPGLFNYDGTNITINASAFRYTSGTGQATSTISISTVAQLQAFINQLQNITTSTSKIDLALSPTPTYSSSFPTLNTSGQISTVKNNLIVTDTVSNKFTITEVTTNAASLGIPASDVTIVQNGQTVTVTAKGYEGDAELQVYIKVTLNDLGSNYNVWNDTNSGNATLAVNSGAPILSTASPKLFKYYANADTTVTVTNTYNAPANQTKLVVSKEAVGVGAATAGTTFTFTLRKDGADYGNQTYTVTGTGAPSGTLTCDGAGKFTLKSGWTATFNALTAGTGTIYEVYESAVSSGFWIRSYEVTAPGGALTGTYTPGSIAGNITIEDGKTTYVKFQNKVAGNISITKNIEGVGASADQTFTFIIKDSSGNPISGYRYYYGGSPYTLGADGKIELKGGETATITYVEAGVNYTVTESTVANWTTAYEVTAAGGTLAGTYTNGLIATVPVELGKMTRVAFRNTYNAPSKLIITKEIVGNEADTNATFTYMMVVGSPAVYAKNLSYTLTGTGVAVPEVKQTDTAGRFYLKGGQTATFEGITAATTYNMTEYGPASGWVKYNEKTTPDGTLTGTYTKSATTGQFEVAVGKTTNVKYKNVAVGNLTLAKGIAGTGADTEQQFTFTIVDEYGNPLSGSSYTLNDNTTGTISPLGKIALKGGQTATITGVPAYTYTITEDAVTDWTAGYETTAAGGTLTGVYTAGASASAGVAYNKTTNVAFRNTYAVDTKSLTVTKTVAGDYADSTKEFSFTPLVKDTNGNAFTNGVAYKKNGTTVTLSNGKLTFKKGDSIVIEGIPANGSIVVTEDDYSAASYTASYKLDNAATTTGGREATVTMSGADHTLAFTNTRDNVTPTETQIDGLNLWKSVIILGISAAVGIAILLMAAHKKRYKPRCSR